MGADRASLLACRATEKGLAVVVERHRLPVRRTVDSDVATAFELTANVGTQEPRIGIEE
jgi:hypothetical protein